MSSNQKLTNRTAVSDTRNQARDKKPKGRGLDLSASQVVGGALAAMTAAALGSQLSAAGTLIGAALASIIAAVAGSLYTASLRRTRDKVKTVFWTGQPNEVEEPTVIDIVADSEGHIAGQRSHLVAPEPDPSARRPRAKLNWKRIAVVALAIFGIAAVSLTTFELVTGRALSGGEGTTFQQVRAGNADNESDTKKKEPADKPRNRATTEATNEASEASTAEPSETASSEPTETPTAPTPEANATTEPDATPSGNR
jgi:hypothetical protein